MSEGTVYPKVSPEADFIGAGDEVVILDGVGGIEAEGILVDAGGDEATVNVEGNWLTRPFDRIAHPDSPQAEAVAMFGEDHPQPRRRHQ